MIQITLNGEKMQVKLGTADRFDHDRGWIEVQSIDAIYTQNGHELVLTGALEMQVTEELHRRGVL